MARAKAPLLINLAGLTMGGPVLIAHGTEAQKRAPSADDPRRRRDLVPGLLRAERRLRPGRAADARGARRRRLRRHRPEGLDELRALRRLVHAAGAHRTPTRRSTRASRFLLVDMHSPGITVRPLRQISGDEDFNEVFFDDVRVPRANVVGEIDEGWEIAITCLMHERADAHLRRQLQSSRRARRHAGDGAQRAAPRATRSSARRSRRRVDRRACHALHRLSQPDAARCAASVPGPEGSIEKLFWSEMYQRQMETAAGAPRAARQLLAAGSPHAVDDGRWPHLVPLLRAAGRSPPAPPRCSATSSPSACCGCREARDSRRRET